MMHWDTINPSPCGSGGSECHIAPESLTSLYNISAAPSTPGNSNSVGVVEFTTCFDVRESDLEEFGREVNSVVPLHIDERGGLPNNQTHPWPCNEAELDIQYAAGIANEATHWVWNTEGWIYEWAIDVQNASAFPSVASLSYAWSEMQVCADIADGKACEQLGINASVYVSRTNEELAKVGMLGISVVVAAGDSGAHGRSDINCDSNEMNLLAHMLRQLVERLLQMVFQTNPKVRFALLSMVPGRTLARQAELKLCAITI